MAPELSYKEILFKYLCYWHFSICNSGQNKKYLFVCQSLEVGKVRKQIPQIWLEYTL